MPKCTRVTQSRPWRSSSLGSTAVPWSGGIIVPRDAVRWHLATNSPRNPVWKTLASPLLEAHRAPPEIVLARLNPSGAILAKYERSREETGGAAAGSKDPEMPVHQEQPVSSHRC